MSNSTSSSQSSIASDDVTSQPPATPTSPFTAQREVELISAAKKVLWDGLAQGLANVIVNMNSSWYGPQSVYYSREKEVLERRYIPPFQYGLAATILLFVNFRVAGTPAFQQWRQSIWQKYYPAPRNVTSKSTITSVPTSSVTSKSPYASKSTTTMSQTNQRESPLMSQPIPQPELGYLARKREAEVERALKSMKFLTDFLVSVSVGVSGTLFLLGYETDRMRNDLEASPLVPGKSLVADQLCPGLLQLSRKDSSVRRALELSTTTIQRDPNFATFVTLIGNCQRRANYEEKIRKEQGKDKGSLVLVPYTGLRE
jgi:hypothetical protein